MGRCSLSVCVCVVGYGIDWSCVNPEHLLSAQDAEGKKFSTRYLVQKGARDEQNIVLEGQLDG